jgi:hypothetical protein
MQVKEQHYETAGEDFEWRIRAIGSFNRRLWRSCDFRFPDNDFVITEYDIKLGAVAL